jgi:hypothetical protein
MPVYAVTPLVGEHRESERALRAADVPFTLLRNGYYTEVYTDPIGQYLQAGEIVGAAGHGRISAASRQDYAAAAATALLHDEGGNRTYELGGPAFGLPDLARAITEVTGATVAYRDLPGGDYASWLQRAGLDEATEARKMSRAGVTSARGRKGLSLAPAEVLDQLADEVNHVFTSFPGVPWGVPWALGWRRRALLGARCRCRCSQAGRRGRRDSLGVVLGPGVAGRAGAAPRGR